MKKERLKIGCCGFATSRASYFKSFSVVEIQETFYEPPRPATAEKWRAEAPKNFEFTLKAWQLITHPATSPTYRRLKTALSQGQKEKAGFFKPTEIVFEAWRRTCEIAKILEAGKVLFQCPASFKPTEENKENLIRFFEEIDRQGLTLIWEPRGEWSSEEIGALCERLKLIHCVDPFVAKPVTKGLRYLRLHGKGGYRYKYTDQDLKELHRMVEGRYTAYVLFNNVSMLEDARRFKALVSSASRPKE